MNRLRNWFGQQRHAAKSAAVDEDELFDEAFQKRLAYLALVSRRLFVGRMRAERPTRRSGTGIEFADHRPYTPGDDIRSLDWNAYQRLERLLVRLYQQEEDLSVYLLIDKSASMAYGHPSKLRYAKRLAAALAYIGLAHLDRVSVLTFDNAMRDRLAPVRGRSRVFRVLDFLRQVEGGGETNVAEALRTFAAQNKRRGVAFLLSDLYDRTGFEEGINVLRYARFEPCVVQLVHPIEALPQAMGEVQLVDVETQVARSVTLTPELVRSYERAHQAYQARIQEFCLSKQVPYVALSVLEPFDEAVLTLLRQGGMLL